MSAVVPVPSLPPSVRHPRAGFENIPHDISRPELLSFFTFSDHDLAEILKCRGEMNRIGFALLLAGVRLTGRLPYNFELVPRSVLKHVCEQLGLEVPLFVDYPPGGRRPTRHTHTERLKAYLGLRSFVEADKENIRTYLAERVLSGARPHELLAQTERMLRQQHTILPGITALEKLIRTARAQAEDELYLELSRRLDQPAKEKILGLLQVPEGQAISTFQQLRQVSRGPSPNALERELDSLTCVRSVLPATLDLNDINPHLLERLASSVSGLPTQALQQFAEPKRLALLLCWLWRLRTQITDTALTINNDLIAGVFRRAKNSAEEERQRRYKRLIPVLKSCGDLNQSTRDWDRSHIWRCSEKAVNTDVV